MSFIRKTIAILGFLGAAFAVFAGFNVPAIVADSYFILGGVVGLVSYFIYPKKPKVVVVQQATE